MKAADLSAENIDRVSCSTIAYFQKKKVKDLVIGCDMRKTSEIFKYGLAARAQSAGINVTLLQDRDNQFCSTPLFMYSCSKNDSWGVMVTASHNPADNNGLKICSPGCRVVGYEDGLNVIEELHRKRVQHTISTSGKLTQLYPLDEFVQETCKQLGLGRNAFSRARLAFDCANSMSAVDAKSFFNFLGADVRYINDWLDGSFPAHEPNPMIPANLKILQSLVKSGSFMCGATGDGDYDRAGIIDELGNRLEAHAIASLVFKYLSNNSQEKVAAIYTTTMGRAFKDSIEEIGGEAAKAPVGRANVINTGLDLMKQGKKVIMGGEGSYHFMFPDKRKNFYENILLVTGAVVAYCLKNNVALSDAAEQSDKYEFLGEKNYAVEPSQRKMLIEKIKKDFSHILPGKLETKDGIFVGSDDAWFSVRESNTESLVRVNVEAKERNVTERVAASLDALITQFGGKIK